MKRLQGRAVLYARRTHSDQTVSRAAILRETVIAKVGVGDEMGHASACQAIRARDARRRRRRRLSTALAASLALAAKCVRKTHMGRIARPRAQRIRHAVGTGGAEGAGRASVMKRLQGRAVLYARRTHSDQTVSRGAILRETVIAEVGVGDEMGHASAIRAIRGRDAR